MWSSVRHIPSMVGPCFQVRWSHGRTPLGAAWISEKGSFASFHQSCQTMPSSAIPTKVPVEVARGGSGVESGIGNKRTADEGKFQAPSLQAQGPLLPFAQGCTRERTRLAFASLCQASRKLRATALATCWNNRRKPVLFPRAPSSYWLVPHLSGRPRALCRFKDVSTVLPLLEVNHIPTAVVLTSHDRHWFVLAQMNGSRRALPQPSTLLTVSAWRPSPLFRSGFG